MKKRFKVFKIISIVLLSILLLLTLGFYVYSRDYYRADSSVENLISTSDNIKIDNNLITIYPKESNSVGLIFYPGGKVEYSSYIPLLEGLSNYGITIYIVKMPFNLAVFNIDAASKIIEQNTNIDSWYLAGHSLGGAMASSYVKDNYSKLDGMILLAAYPINDAPLDTISIYGSQDKVLDNTKLDNVLEKYEIDGGNHAYFGNYGEQEGDGIASISRSEQQEITVNKIIEFINK
jgi:hypothetical protein